MTVSDVSNVIVAGGVILGIAWAFVKGYFTIIGKLDKLADSTGEHGRQIELLQLKYEGLEERLHNVEVLGKYKVVKIRENEEQGEG